MKYKKVIPALLAIFFLVFMAMNFQGVDRVWINWVKGEKQEYKGNIELWHIKDDFDLRLPYASMVKKYEKKNFGVFINITYLTQNEAKEKLAAGSEPDIVTYSKAFLEDLENGYTSLEKVDNPILSAGEKDGKLLAYPISYDSYRLIVNDDILSENEVEVPGIVDMDFIKTSIVGGTFKEGINPIGFSEPGAALNFLSAAGEEYPFEYIQGSLKDFEAGKVVALVCSSIDLEKYTGELPSYTDLYINSITDRIRFLSVYGGKNDGNRLQCSKEIASEFMSERFQRQIADYGFSPLYGHTSIKSEEISPIKVFYNNLDEDTIIKMMATDRRGLIAKIKELSIG